MAGLDAAHGVLQGRMSSELRLKRTPQLAFEYDPTVEHGVRMSKLIDELAPGPRHGSTDNGDDDEADLAAVVGGDPLPRASSSRRTRTRTETRSGRCSHAPRPPVSSARRASCTSPAGRRCRANTGSWRLSELARALPADAAERVLLAVDCANESRLGPDRDVCTGVVHDQRRPPPRQLALRRRQSRRGRGVLDG